MAKVCNVCGCEDWLDVECAEIKRLQALVDEKHKHCVKLSDVVRNQQDIIKRLNRKNNALQRIVDNVNR